MTTITLSKSDAAGVKSDAVVIGVVKSGGGVTLPAGTESLNAAYGGKLVEVLSGLGATGKAGEVTKVPGPNPGKSATLIAVGLGAAPDGELKTEDLRTAAGTGVRAAKISQSVAFALPTPDAECVRAVAEGALMGRYAFTAYKSSDGANDAPGNLTVLTDLARNKDAKAALERAQVTAEAVAQVRDWVNTPPSDLHPAEFAADAVKLGKEYGVKVEVLDEKALAKGGYGGILGVGQGSSNPPRLVRLTYTPRKPVTHLAFVGKGITFDSGGLSLKTSTGMVSMKSDMAGAAAVIGATIAIARLGLPVQVTSYAAMAENMPSGSAARPSDVLTMYGGKTVEVLNTDAEGRLVLGDALVRASADQPDLIIDVATLTGACVVALGTKVAGAFGNTDTARDRVVDAAVAAGESMWPLPIPAEMLDKLKSHSKVADLANITGEPWGGALAAAAFLGDFVADGIDWVHLDVAGPAFNDGGPSGYTPTGGTGYAVRTLVELAASAS
ncbi:leucyl aminopeptidase [Kribbella sindirgiensis]|uniref:Probable cytosol aminopeptidase n=1 Tax=Kribbella sindirgiensis TaxID=1124744 RepID=A0A4R0IJD3_9ACTN|nr:leucyl aminopeptidase [Kribbella sindirgiensis]TCC33571.1 leucyl aminopeptidase [Kribbella sindirgiensis]